MYGFYHLWLALALLKMLWRVFSAASVYTFALAEIPLNTLEVVAVHTKMRWCRLQVLFRATSTQWALI